MAQGVSVVSQEQEQRGFVSTADLNRDGHLDLAVERKAKSAFHPEDAERFQQLAREWRTIAEQAKGMTAVLSDADTHHANSQRTE